MTEIINTKFTCRDVRVHYGDFEALHGIDTVSYTHLTLPTTPYV